MLKYMWVLLLVCYLPRPVFAQEIPEENTAQLRLIHYGEGVPVIDVLVDDELVLRDLSYESVSRWLVLPLEAETLTIIPAGQGDAPLFSLDLALEAEQWSSLLLIGNQADNTLTTRLLPHTTTDLAPDLTRLAFFNAQPQPIRIEVDGAITVENMGFGEAPWGTDEPARNFPAQIWIGDNRVVDIASLAPFEAMTSYLIVLREKAGQFQTDVIPLRLHTYVYVANFDLNAPEQVDLYVDGELRIGNVAYTNVSRQLELPAGQYEVAIVPTGAALDAAIYSEQTSFQPNTNSIIMLVDNKTFVLKIQSEALTYANKALEQGENAEIWFYNGLDTVVNVQRADGITLLEGLNEDIATLDLPADTYDLTIDHAGGRLFDLPGLVLRGGNVYLVALLATTDGGRTTHLSAYCVRAEGC